MKYNTLTTITTAGSDSDGEISAWNNFVNHLLADETTETPVTFQMLKDELKKWNARIDFTCHDLPLMFETRRDKLFFLLKWS
jgi:hypothetical protein